MANNKKVTLWLGSGRLSKIRDAQYNSELLYNDPYLLPDTFAQIGGYIIGNKPFQINRGVRIVLDDGGAVEGALYNIISAMPDESEENTIIVTADTHGLVPGSIVVIIDTLDDLYIGTWTVIDVTSSTQFTIETTFLGDTNVGTWSLGTGFDIMHTYDGSESTIVVTAAPHGLSQDQEIIISDSGNATLDDTWTVSQIISPTEFRIGSDFMSADRGRIELA